MNKGASSPVFKLENGRVRKKARRASRRLQREEPDVIVPGWEWWNLPKPIPEEDEQPPQNIFDIAELCSVIAEQLYAPPTHVFDRAHNVSGTDVAALKALRLVSRKCADAAARPLFRDIRVLGKSNPWHRDANTFWHLTRLSEQPGIARLVRSIQFVDVDLMKDMLLTRLMDHQAHLADVGFRFISDRILPRFGGLQEVMLNVDPTHDQYLRLFLTLLSRTLTTIRHLKISFAVERNSEELHPSTTFDSISTRRLLQNLRSLSVQQPYCFLWQAGDAAMFAAAADRMLQIIGPMLQSSGRNLQHLQITDYCEFDNYQYWWPLPNLPLATNMDFLRELDLKRVRIRANSLVHVLRASRRTLASFKFVGVHLTQGYWWQIFTEIRERRFDQKLVAKSGYYCRNSSPTVDTPRFCGDGGNTDFFGDIVSLNMIDRHTYYQAFVSEWVTEAVKQRLRRESGRCAALTTSGQRCQMRTKTEWSDNRAHWIYRDGRHTTVTPWICSVHRTSPQHLERLKYWPYQSLQHASN